MMTRRFPIHLGRRSRFVLLLFGVRPSNAYVDLGEDELDAHFGFFQFRTQRATSPRGGSRARGVGSLRSASASASASTT